MILSMTGYGKAESQLKEHRKVIVEVRSLNSKSLDLSMRLAPQLRAKELDIRAIVSQRLERGKIDLNIYYQDTANPESGMGFSPVNREAFAYYYTELSKLQQQYNLQNVSLLDSILRIPDVFKPTDDTAEAGEQEWDIVRATLHTAIDAFLTFRTQEGAALERMFTEKLDGIAVVGRSGTFREKSGREDTRAFAHQSG